MRIILYIFLAKLTILVSCSCTNIDPRLKKGQNIGEDMGLFIAKIERFGMQVCTGVLLDQQWILTLKRCIQKRSLAKYKVSFEDFDTGEFVTRKFRKLKELGERNAEVILLELDIIIQRKVLPIDNFYVGSINNIKKEKCMAVGFTSNGKSLNKVKVSLKSPKKCSSSKCKRNVLFDTNNDAEVCRLDNGAPVFCKFENRWLLIGLSFVKKGCERRNIQTFALSHLSRSISKAIKEEQKTCVSAECVISASQIINAIDTDINPCDNFYKFACGNFIKMTPIPEDELYYTPLIALAEDVPLILKHELEEPYKPNEIEAVIKAKEFYKACMDTDKIEEKGNAPLHKLMEELGGLPVLGSSPGGNWDSDAFSFESLVVKCFQITTNIPIYNIHLDDVFLTDQERFRLNFDQPVLILPRESYILGKDDPILLAYKSYYIELFKAFGANESTAIAFAESTLDLEIDLANVTTRQPCTSKDTIAHANDINHISSADRYASSGIEIVTVGELQALQTKVNNTRIVEGIYALGGFSVDLSDKITIYSLGYFNNTESVLNKYQDSVIANYMVSRVVMTQINFLPQIYRDITNRFYLEAMGRTDYSSRLEKCISILEHKMPDVTARIFGKVVFIPEERNYMLDMIQDLKLEFKQIIDATKWMSQFSKNASKEKVDAMGVEVGYPEEAFNSTLLNSVHKNFVVVPESPFNTAVSMSKAEMIREAELLRKILDVTPWISASSLLVNAFYYGSYFNSILIPSGILQPNVYSDNRPDYMNYGAIGVIAAHEIIHGFVDDGLQIDKDGQPQAWWLKEDIAKYVNKTECFINMWNNFTVPETGGMKNNGELTLREVLCDHEGLRIGFKTYRRLIEKRRKGKEEDRLPGLPYTPNQLFFLNSVQSFCTNIRKDFKKFWLQVFGHPLSSIRYVGLMQNSEGFAEAWGCPVRSKMNRSDKCTLFQ